MESLYFPRAVNNFVWLSKCLRKSLHIWHATILWASGECNQAYLASLLYRRLNSISWGYSGRSFKLWNHCNQPENKFLVPVLRISYTTVLEMHTHLYIDDLYIDECTCTWNGYFTVVSGISVDCWSWYLWYLQPFLHASLSLLDNLRPSSIIIRLQGNGNAECCSKWNATSLGVAVAADR